MTAAAEGGAGSRRVVVVGTSTLARLVCSWLSEDGASVEHLPTPGEQELQAALRGGVDAIAVLVHDDHLALRYALMSAHIAPETPITASIFDRTVASRLHELIPWCSLTTPGNLVAPSLAGACVGSQVVAARASGVVLRREGVGLVEDRWRPTSQERLQGLLGRLAGQARPFDAGSRLMVVGLLGLLTVLLTDTGILALHDRAAASAAFFEATRVVTTVGPVNLVNGAGYVWWSSFAMLVTLAFTAAFTAGLVEYFASPRLVSLVGRRTLPRRGHVIVVGLGQVGLRLCQELRGLGIAVVAVERHASAPAVRIARTRKIPVLIADGEDRAVLEQLRLRHARALVAASSDEMDNVAVAVAARAVAPGGRVVLRAGNHELISETRSLLPLGTTRDVTAMAAAWMSAHLLGQRPTGVCADADHVWVEVPGAGFRLWPQSTRAGCCHPASSVGLDHSG